LFYLSCIQIINIYQEPLSLLNIHRRYLSTFLINLTGKKANLDEIFI
jgi:hypothetical protein